jgi:type IV pilus assembly protein PilB
VSDNIAGSEVVNGSGGGSNAESDIEDRERARELALRYRYEFVDLRDLHLDLDLLRSTPVDLMFRYNFVPLELSGDALVVAMADPGDLVAVDEVAALLDRPLVIKVAAISEISELLKKSESSQRVLDEATEGFRLALIREDESGDETITIEKITQEESSPIIRLVDTIIFTALGRRASDVHIETGASEVIVKYRVDGSLARAMDPIAKEHHSTIISRIKVMSELDISEKRVPQDGRFRTRYKGRSIDFRVSIMPSTHGEDAVIRILDKESINEDFRTLSLDVVGFAEKEIQLFRRYIKEPYGMVLVTGPTGSGKTTTLYGALMEIRNEEDKIITIEDPVEYQIEGITQIPVNEKKGLTFARGLRSILRHDPDKIMVGEIRDMETAQIAIQSALTGHLVFTTVHANNVVDVLGRFLNMGVDPYNFVSALNCILAQRLVRLICPNCKKEVNYAPEFLAESRLDGEQYASVVFYEGEGCLECNGTGFRGRTAIQELLDLSDSIREMIIDKRPTSEIKRAAGAQGMTFLRESAIAKVLEGKTTIQEINKVTFIE